jgi:hypothetical protein
MGIWFHILFISPASGAGISCFALSQELRQYPKGSSALFEVNSLSAMQPVVGQG